MVRAMKKFCTNSDVGAGRNEPMGAMAPADMMQHIDEFLLPLGPATGALMNILI
jgi:hypothetical protein